MKGGRGEDKRRKEKKEERREDSKEAEHSIVYWLEEFQTINSNSSHTVRCSNEGIDVSQEEESTNESINLISRSFWKLFLHKGSCCLAQPSDAKRNLING